MLGFDLELLNLSAPEVIEKFRKDIEKELKRPVTAYSVFHQCDSNQIEIKVPPNDVKIIKGRMLSFVVKKVLKMKLKKDVDFTTIELVHGPDKNIIVMKTAKGIETQTV